MTTYNVITIVCFTLVIVGTVWLFMGLCDSLNVRIWKIILWALCSLIIIIFLIGMFLSISYKECEVTGTIEDVQVIGSWAGLMDTYTVDIDNGSGNIIRLHTSLFASPEIKKILSDIKKGDKISAYYGGYFDTVFSISVEESY